MNIRDLIERVASETAWSDEDMRHINNGDKVADAILSALVGAGFVIIPREATEDVILEGAYALDRPSLYMGGPSRANQRRARECYAVMIDASLEKNDD